MRQVAPAVPANLEGQRLRMVDDGVDAIAERDLVELAPTLLAAARYLVHSEAEADDLVQATLEIAVRHGNQLRDPASLRAWLLRIETREAFRLRRRLRSFVSLDRAIVEVPVRNPSDDDLAVRLAVAGLPARQRAAVVLHHLAALPVAQTAEAMGVSENTVKTLLRLGLARLREVLT